MAGVQQVRRLGSVDNISFAGCGRFGRAGEGCRVGVCGCLSFNEVDGIGGGGEKGDDGDEDLGEEEPWGGHGYTIDDGIGTLFLFGFGFGFGLKV